MGFFNKLKSNILGSVKEDVNSALGGKQQLFNSKISGALDDLIAMKTGIQISNVPKNITERQASEAEARRLAALGPMGGMTSGARGHTMSTVPPAKRKIMRFPTDDSRYIDNWIVFRTVSRKVDAQHLVGGTNDTQAQTHADFFGQTGLHVLGEQELVQGRGERKSYKLNETEVSDPVGVGGGLVVNEGVTIALYFPNNVKDTISVEYDTLDVGIGDTIINSIFGKGERGIDRQGFFDALGDGVSEAFKANVANKMIAIRAMQEGTAANNPKFTNFQGVSLREHTYTFTMNPYNETDAEAITGIIESFKLLALPSFSNSNPRLKILPAEFSIDFFGPILGHIEHPQNCFLSTVDVDYSGGKDMSFISKEEYVPRQTKMVTTGLGSQEERELNPEGGSVVHYPNGITLTLTFKEILTLTRQRYSQRVAPSAMGVVARDTVKDLMFNDMGAGDDISNHPPLSKQSTSDDDEDITADYSTLMSQGKLFGTKAKAQETLNNMPDKDNFQVQQKTVTIGLEASPVYVIIPKPPVLR